MWPILCPRHAAWEGGGPGAEFGAAERTVRTAVSPQHCGWQGERTQPRPRCSALRAAPRGRGGQGRGPDLFLSLGEKAAPGPTHMAELVEGASSEDTREICVSPGVKSLCQSQGAGVTSGAPRSERPRSRRAQEAVRGWGPRCQQAGLQGGRKVSSHLRVWAERHRWLYQ